MDEALHGMRLRRAPNVRIGRPFDFCFDAAGMLWESYATSLIRYDPRTERADSVVPQALPGRSGNALARLGDALVLFHYAANDYTTIAPRTGESARCPLPSKPDGDAHDIWFCVETGGKVIAFDRARNGAVLVLDRAGTLPRRIACPFGDLEMTDGTLLDDGRVLIPTAGRMTLLIFDPQREIFTDAIPSDYDVSFTWGCMAHDGRAYVADTSGGRLLVCDIAARRWLHPVQTPDHGKLYGYIGQGFQIGSRGYFNLNTWLGQEGIDRRTHQLATPPGYITNTVDGRRMRFLDRFLVYDAAAGEFDYLISPPQEDGVAELCYSKIHDGRVFITGHVIPTTPGKELTYGEGDYCVWHA